MIPAAATRPAPLRATFLSRLRPATRLALVTLGIASTLLLPPGPVLLLWGMLVGLLAVSGLTPRHLLRSLRPWWPVAVLVLLTHTLTTTEAAPLGRPSWLGALRGLQALLKVACTMSWLGLYLRVTTQPDLIAGLAWWLAPLDRVGVRSADLGLALAVMGGTVPQVMAEGRRVDLVSRLREAAPAVIDAESTASLPARPNRLRRTWRSLLRRLRMVMPLMESLARRAEALTLSLRTRRPVVPEKPQGPTAGEFAVLAIWLAALVAWSVAGPGRSGW